MKLVIVKHPGNVGLYLFRVPGVHPLSAGDRVLCRTKRGESEGICVCDDFNADGAELEKVKECMGATELRPVIGVLSVYRWEDEDAEG